VLQGDQAPQEHPSDSPPSPYLGLAPDTGAGAAGAPGGPGPQEHPSDSPPSPYLGVAPDTGAGAAGAPGGPGSPGAPL
jgi:hypothetical protein